MVKHTQIIRRQQPINCLSVSDHLIINFLLDMQSLLMTVLLFKTLKKDKTKLGYPKFFVFFIAQILI